MTGGSNLRYETRLYFSYLHGVYGSLTLHSLRKENIGAHSRGVVYKGMYENISVTEIIAMELMNGSMLGLSEGGLYSTERMSQKSCSGVVTE